MTTVHKKRHGGIRRWLVRNSLSLALIGIILLSMTVGAIGCLAFLPKPQDTSTPKTKTDVSTATVMQPDIISPSLEPVPEPQVFYFDIPLSEELQDYIREKCSEYEVPMELVIALIDKESSFRSDVVSTTNDYGFMQINQCRGRYLRHALASWDLPVIDISDEKQVEERIIWYFNHCVEDDIKPTVSGMCNALGIERKTFYQWQVGECRERSHTPIIKKARAILEEMWEDWMVDGKINPVVGIFLGKNHFGYADKQDIIVTPNNPLGEARDPEEVRQRYLDSVVVDELPPDDGEEND